MAGIYIHIPFCHKACSYCNFHFSTQFTLREPLIESILKEIDLVHTQWNHLSFETIYFGGGTPSAIPPEDISKIIDRLHQYFNLSQLQETTIEANPDDITVERLQQWYDMGIDRISMGIQSFQDGDLTLMNRNHTAEQAHRALQWMIDSPINAVNADLIYGTPGLTDDLLRDNINQLLRYPVQHISAYALTVEPRTAYAHQIATQKVKAPSEDDIARQFLLVHKELVKADFDHYEISNYGLPGHHALHNTNYWHNKPYLGIGPAAHSYTGQERRLTIPHNPKYIEHISSGRVPQEIESIDASTAYNEKLLTAFRLRQGLEKSYIHSLPKHLKFHFHSGINQLLSTNQVRENNSHYFLTTEKMLFADGIASDLMYIQ